MRACSAHDDLQAQRALAPGLQLTVGGLPEDGDVAGQELGAIPGEVRQAVVDGGDLLAGVEDEGEVHRRVGDRLGQRDHDGQTALHVGGPEPPEHVALDASASVVVGGHRVGVPGQHHPARSAQVGAGDQVGAHPLHREVGQGAEPALEVVGERRLVVALGGDVDQRGGEGQEIDVGHPRRLRGWAPPHRYGWRPMSSPDSPTGGARGVGLATHTPDGRVLDTWFPAPVLEGSVASTTTAVLSAASAAAALGEAAASVGHDPRRAVEVVAVETTIADLQAAPADSHDVWLRLHLLSHRLVRPNTINLEGIFGLLQTVAWTQVGPVAADELPAAQAEPRAAGEPLLVHGLDKFPRLLDYVVPSGVRIADAYRVRLGAHLAEGTTVMHEGFVNFNAGTLGTAMVEGRIVQGVVVGDGTDIGGGASILGTLSGGGTEVVRIGERCLLGANSGVGISLGDECIVEAGLYLTGGMRVTLPDGTVTKAKELSGRSGILFIRNSQTGTVEARSRAGGPIPLNDDLHGNN